MGGYLDTISKESDESHIHNLSLGFGVGGWMGTLPKDHRFSAYIPPAYPVHIIPGTCQHIALTCLDNEKDHREVGHEDRPSAQQKKKHLGCSRYRRTTRSG